MPKREEMIGKRFGRLVVTAISPNTSGKRKRLMYYCDCDCGEKNVEIIGEKLRNGHTKSCGCLKRDMASATHKKYNEYDLSGDFGTGKTSNTNKEFYFDKEDYDLIKQYCWLEMKNGYIASRTSDKESIYLHRFVMKAGSRDIVDHKKHNLMDCRKKSLRVGTQSNNMMNTTMRKDNTSGTVGVSFDKINGKWVAEIWFNKKKIRLGSFKEKKDAINARKEAEEKYFKGWSYDNSTKEKVS